MRPCTLCPGICRSRCPAYTVRPLQQYSPHGFVRTLEIIAENKRLRRHATNVYACTLCYACRDACPLTFNVPASILEARAMVPFPTKPRRGTPKPVMEVESATVLYLSSPYAAGEVRMSLAEVLERAWGSVRIVEARGVYEAYATADSAWFNKCVRALEKFAEGVDVVVSDSPEIVHVLRGIMNVETHVRHLHALSAEGRVKLKGVVGKVIVHDPCISARVLGEDKLLRDLLSLYGIEWVEPERSEKETFCCGGGGLVDITQPRISREIAETRASMLASANFPTLTACQRCRDSLSRVGLKVLDISEAIHV